MKSPDVGGRNFIEDAAIDFANALVNNSSLSKLQISGRGRDEGRGDNDFDDRIWCAFTCFLDVSSIESTYLSYHILHTLEIEDWDLYDEWVMVVLGELAPVFQMNTNEDKAALAITYHFSGKDVDTQAFSAMAVPILPAANKLIDKDLAGFFLMYHVTQGITALLMDQRMGGGGVMRGNTTTSLDGQEATAPENEWGTTIGSSAKRGSPMQGGGPALVDHRGGSRQGHNNIATIEWVHIHREGEEKNP